jgi:hypothetical protein
MGMGKMGPFLLRETLDPLGFGEENDKPVEGDGELLNEVEESLKPSGGVGKDDVEDSSRSLSLRVAEAEALVGVVPSSLNTERPNAFSIPSSSSSSIRGKVFFPTIIGRSSKLILVTLFFPALYIPVEDGPFCL